MFKNNTDSAKKRFEFHTEGHIAFIEYILNKSGVIYLTHTEVPKALEGKGIGTELVQRTLEYIRKESWLVAPLCPFVAYYLKKHPEQAEGILAPGFSVG